MIVEIFLKDGFENLNDNSSCSGGDCRLNQSPCSSNPCPEGKICTDLPPGQQSLNQSGYSCGACHAGYNYNTVNDECLDIYECSSATLNNCTQICVIALGSFSCM